MKVIKVTGPDGIRLVHARSINAAIDYVVGKSFTAENVSAADLLEFFRQGIEVEDVANDHESQGEDESAEAKPSGASTVQREEDFIVEGDTEESADQVTR